MELLVFVLLGVSFFLGASLFNKDSILDDAVPSILILVSVGLLIWFIFAVKEPTKFEKETSYDISLMTLDNRQQFQYAIVDSDIVNITKLFPSVYPDDYKLNKRVVDKWYKGIHFSMLPDYHYTITDADGNDIITIYRNHGMDR